MSAVPACLFFGTFNPIHVGHLAMAQAVWNQFGARDGISTVTFIPSGQPPHRLQDPDLALARHRFNMVMLATADNPRFRVSDAEVAMTTPSYTVQTVETLFGDCDEPVSIIIGSDALAQMSTWHRPDDLIRRVRFLQVVRPGSPLVESVIIAGRQVPLNTEAVDFTPLDIAASRIRRLIASHPAGVEAARYLLPDAVVRYIRQNRLYTGESPPPQA